MTQVIRWLKNLPWKLCETFICDWLGHKPAKDLELIAGVTVCERCMAPLKFTNGQWDSNLAMQDIKPKLCFVAEKSPETSLPEKKQTASTVVSEASDRRRTPSGEMRVNSIVVDDTSEGKTK